MPRVFRIHPAIGVARMGNSPDGFFIGPETPGLDPNWNEERNAFNSFRDAQGRILRQGARFRVFEYFADGQPREVQLGDDVRDVEWRVHLANRKASFFVFDGQNGAADNYVSRSQLPGDAPLESKEPARNNLRNSDITDPVARAALEIDPGEQRIAARGGSDVELLNPNSRIPIRSLGTLKVDERGRLIVLGGYGESNTTAPEGDPRRQIDEYASNDTWFDDAGDGPVKARIVLADGTTVDAQPAWIMVGPPDFAPSVGNVVSLFDTLWDTAVRELTLPAGEPATPLMTLLQQQQQAWRASGGTSLAGFKPSFVRDIYPLLKRAVGATEVHVSGVTNPHYHRTLKDWGKLATREGADMRRYIFSYMRNPDAAEIEWKKMPRGLGDDYASMDSDDGPGPRALFSLTRIQFAVLREWAAGNFVPDWPGAEPRAAPLANPTPDDLDRAAADNSVGGPLYPGIDVSWLIRVADIYDGPFRFRASAAPAGEATEEPRRIGAVVFRPGFFSQQMALPWQADFYDCHKERREDPDRNEYYFMWWTAHRPDDVFPSGQAKQVRWVRLFDEHKLEGSEDPDGLENLARFTQMQQRWPELKFISVHNQELGHFEEEP